MKRTVFFFLIAAACLNAESGPVHFGAAAGIGLPKIPVSHFRTPLSVLAGGMGHVSVAERFGIQLDGYALTTFSLGTVNRAGGDLQFDILWGSLAMSYRFRGFMNNRSAVLAGFGRYHLVQQFDFDREVVRTGGVNLGLSNWMIRPTWRGMFEVRWHLLFRPSENPQMLTLTLGWIF